MQFGFAKYHALGNDYIVIDPKDLPSPLTVEQIKTICHRNFGVGSDGILLGPLPAEDAEMRAQNLQSRRQRGRKKRQRPAHFLALFLGPENCGRRGVRHSDGGRPRALDRF